MNKIESFIAKLKQNYEKEFEDRFSNGYCYWLATILADRFKGEIWFNPTLVHFATMIDDDLYDIYGIIHPDTLSNYEDWVSWEEFQYTHQEAVESIVNSCIKKDYP